MKNLLIISLLFIATILSAQQPYRLNLYLSPIGFDIGKINYDELGLGTYEVNKLHSNNIEGTLILSKHVFKNIYFDLGVSIEKWKYQFEFIISDPYNSMEAFDKENRFLNRYMISPDFGLHYEKNKFFISVGGEPHFELKKDGNIRNRISDLTIFIDTVNQQSSHIYYKEAAGFPDDILLYFTPSVKFYYHLVDRLSIGFDAKIKPYGHSHLYRMLIKGKTFEMEDGDYILNDLRINNKIMLFYIGVNYTIF